ncbi:hypothetical protein SAY86_020330 [Trapa natans]|uniref:Pentatricopeptide repeat-containing protein n=1 Tax=Trapa natans TaxID=22666 RepID=A0AAN7LMG0_TRANT|nr:hypothetical protein SAY86_020330 [Trapa natans]
MMNVYATAGCYHEVEAIFKSMEDEGFFPDSSSYLSLIRAYTVSSKYVEAEETLKSMERKGIIPNCAHLHVLVSAYTKAGMIEQAGQIYKRLTGNGLMPDAACYRTMLGGYLRRGYIEEGIAFFEQIKENLGPDRFIWSMAVDLYRAAGMEIEAGGALSIMNSFDIPPSSENIQAGSKSETSSSR